MVGNIARFADERAIPSRKEWVRDGSWIPGQMSNGAISNVGIVVMDGVLAPHPSQQCTTNGKLASVLLF